MIQFSIVLLIRIESDYNWEQDFESDDNGYTDADMISSTLSVRAFGENGFGMNSTAGASAVTAATFGSSSGREAEGSSVGIAGSC